MKGARIDERALDSLMPMHLIFDGSGRIRSAGPTVAKMAGGLTGRRLGDAITFRRPTMSGDPDEVLEHPGRRLMVELRGPREDDEPQRLRAVVAPLPQGGGVLNFTFGPDLADAVRRHDLSAGDFSAVDPVLEILFLLESQSLIRAELAALAGRLDHARREAEEEAATDRLTGLRNRRAMDQRLARLCALREPVFGLMQLDLDHFKAVNDTLGHAAGDAVLEEVAALLREETRNGDFIARVGGDEFVLIFEEGVSADRLGIIAERILMRLDEPFVYDGRSCEVSGSIGITLSTSYDHPDAEAMLADADTALYRSKHEGRSRFCFHDAPAGTDTDLQEIRAASRLRRAAKDTSAA